jgi:putative ABC transport system permease protein
MLKYLFLKIIRNFNRNIATNLVNLLGLTLSLALVIYLSAYCYSELTTDNFHKNGENVYLYLRSENTVYTPGILKDNIDLKVPGIESAVRITGTWEAPVFQAENREPVTADLLFADEGFFDLFTFEVVEGNPESVIKEPMTVVITETLAKKLFGTDDPIGKNIKLNNDRELTVGAIIKEPAANSCLSLSAVSSMSTQKIVMGQDGEYTEWGWCDFQTFLLLQKGSDRQETEKRILSIIPADFHKDYENAKLVPLNKIYFSKFMLYGNDYLVNGDKRKVMVLALVAALVLIVALVNFINISSAQRLERIKQTGVVKILGAARSAVLFEVFFESFIFFLAALLVAIDIVNVIAPLLDDYTGVHYNKDLTYSFGFLSSSLAAIIVLSTIFSIVPGLRISSSKVIDNLKSGAYQKRAGFSHRNVLVTVQFIIAIILTAFTLLVQKQIRFGRSDIGFNQSNIIGIKLTPQLLQNKEVLKKLLLDKPVVSKVSYTQYYPGKDLSEWMSPLSSNGETKKVDFDTFSADASFFEITGIKLVSGRFYSNDFSTDKEKVVVNETFLKKYDLINPVGGIITSGKRNLEIIGVCKDFHFQSLRQPIVPLVIRNDSFSSYCLVNIITTDFKSLKNVIAGIKEIGSQLSPSFPVEVDFFDQAVGEMYKSELMFQRSFSMFAASAIIICCFGILAMSLFSCQQRTKEIGIRKISGARSAEVMTLLNKELVKLVITAFIFATPMAWYLMHKWIQSFAYQTRLSWWIFALAGLIALAIALMTASWQTWRASTRNPVESLRYE